MVRSENERRSSLLAKCKFYNGEDDCPSGVDFICWEVEAFWVRSLLKGKTLAIDMAVVSFRRLVDISDPLFKDGTPLAVQALLFERYCHDSDLDPLSLATSFKRFYAKHWFR